MFDLNSQSGVMVILASVRASELSPSEKNEIRDLVFLYTNGGKDESVRIALEQKLSFHNIKPVSAKKTAATNGPALPFGSSRPVPTFKAPVILAPAALAGADTTLPVAPAPTPATPPPVSLSQAAVVPPTPTEPKPIPPPVTPPTTPPVVASVATPTTPPSPVAPPTPTPPVVPPAADIPAPPQTPVSTPADQAPAVAQVTSPVEVTHLDRIKQIKSAVNSKVGNPVNLVDINNEVGREYMNALLEAMKKLSAGAESELPTAMSRLEAAYAAVEETLKNYVKPTVTPQPVAASVPPPATQPPSAPPASSLAKSPLTPPSPVPETLASLGSDMLQSAVVPVPVLGNAQLEPAPIADMVEVAEEPKPASAPFPGYIPAPTPAKAPVHTPPPIAPTPNVILDLPGSEGPVAVVPPTPQRGAISFTRPTGPLSVRSEEASSPAPVGLKVNPTPAQGTTPPKPVSLADFSALKKPSDLPSADSLSTSADGNPLYTKEVEDGLEQLLSDWILFKKSGFLGRGPKGREHPLFKKIAPLPVPLLLAGRFDGATQEVRQSITDYMNGWRYEQGIVYEQGETFELYLRRVIRHILDLQKKRKG